MVNLPKNLCASTAAQLGTRSRTSEPRNTVHHVWSLQFPKFNQASSLPAALPCRLFGRKINFSVGIAQRQVSDRLHTHSPSQKSVKVSHALVSKYKQRPSHVVKSWWIRHTGRAVRPLRVLQVSPNVSFWPDQTLLRWRSHRHVGPDTTQLVRSIEEKPK